MPPLRFPVLFARAPLRSRGAVVLALAALVAVTAACQPTKKSTPPPAGPPSQYCYPTVPANAAQYQDAFNEFRIANTGLFVAADGSLPFRLPDGRVLWFFGDTLVGLRKPGQPVNPLLGFNTNSFVIQEGRCFKPWFQPIPNPDSGNWIWPTDAIVQNNVLLVFGSHMQGQFADFDFVSIDVARFSFPDLTFLGSAPLPIPVGTPMGEPGRPNYGENVTVDGTTVYAYGRVRQCAMCLVDHHFVARAPLAQVLSSTEWEFWDDPDPLITGDEMWIPDDPTVADPMLFDGSDMLMLTDKDEGPVAAFPVSKLAAPGQYLGSALNVDAFGTDLQTWDGAAPTGPWFIRPTEAADIGFSKTGPCPIGYGGQVVLDLSGVAPMALWSLNQSTFGTGPCGPYPSGFDAVLANPDLYKAFFANPAAGSLP